MLDDRGFEHTVTDVAKLEQVLVAAFVDFTLMTDGDVATTWSWSLRSIMPAGDALAMAHRLTEAGSFRDARELVWSCALDTPLL